MYIKPNDSISDTIMVGVHDAVSAGGRRRMDGKRDAKTIRCTAGIVSKGYFIFLKGILDELAHIYIIYVYIIRDRSCTEILIAFCY